tara:strand:+ start:3134 stop:3262 length:129 start_codon:yes stop_codon:yes gene_type:complete
MNTTIGWLFFVGATFIGDPLAVALGFFKARWKLEPRNQLPDF